MKNNGHVEDSSFKRCCSLIQIIRWNTQVAANLKPRIAILPRSALFFLLLVSGVGGDDVLLSLCTDCVLIGAKMVSLPPTPLFIKCNTKLLLVGGCCGRFNLI